MIEILKVNNTYGRIVSDDALIMSGVIRRFSIKAENYQFMPKYKAGQWDGKILFVKRNGLFELGHLQKIINYFKDEEDRPKIDPKLMIPKLDQVSFIKEFNDITERNINSEIIPREYQIRGSLKAIYKRRAILEHCTGSGKSLSLFLMINYLVHKNPGKKIILIVPTIDLISQMREDLISYGMKEELLGNFYGKEKNFKTSVTISTWQSIYDKKDLLEQCFALFVDECHGVKSDEIKKVSEYSINAEYKIGTTGTMPDHKCNYWSVEGALGPVVDQVFAKDLIKLKQISDINISIVKFIYKKEILDLINIKEYSDQKQFLIDDKKRNLAICNIAKKHASKDENILILVRRVDHGKSILKILEESGCKCNFICGDTEKDIRSGIRHKMNDESGIITVATTGVFSTGISINRLHVVIFGSAGKSKIQTLQSVGRGLRMHITKNKLQLYDITENLTLSEKHLGHRIGYYKKNEFPFKIFEIPI